VNAVAIELVVPDPEPSAKRVVPPVCKLMLPLLCLMKKLKPSVTPIVATREFVVSLTVIDGDEPANTPFPLTDSGKYGDVVPTPMFPTKYAFPVVVAPPATVSPVVWVPPPIVDDALTTIPSVVVGAR
jgi:hypothetical protein